VNFPVRRRGPPRAYKICRGFKRRLALDSLKLNSRSAQVLQSESHCLNVFNIPSKLASQPLQLKSTSASETETNPSRRHSAAIDMPSQTPVQVQRRPSETYECTTRRVAKLEDNTDNCKLLARDENRPSLLQSPRVQAWRRL